MDEPTKLNETIHPIFEGVNPAGLTKIDQKKTLAILQMVEDGYSYNEVSNSFLLEKNIKISPQGVGHLVKKYMDKYRRTKV